MPFKLSEEEQRLGLITICVVLLFLFYLFFLGPKLNQGGAVKNQLKLKQLELKVAEQKVKSLQAIEKTMGAVSLKSELPRETKALEVLRLISQAADSSDLNLVLIKPLTEPATSEGIKFDLSCSGSYRQLYDFLSFLFHLPIIVMIDNLDIVSEGGTKPVLNVKIALTAYY